MTDNVYYYVGNYRRVTLCVGVCVLYKHPAALVGIAAAARSWEWLHANSPAGSENTTLHKIKCVHTLNPKP